MTKNTQRKLSGALNNQAHLTKENATDSALPGCVECDEPILFALRDQHHEFAIGLSTLLSCLKFAEQENAIPPLSQDWWNKVNLRYKTNP